MKIAVNTRLLIPSKMDGIGRFTLEVVKNISQNHPEHEFTLIFDRDINEFDFPKNVKFKVIKPEARLPILWKLWIEILLKRFINKNGFDLFISPEGWLPPGLNCPSLSVIHDLNFMHYPENIIKSHRDFLNSYFPKFVQRSTHIATVSEFSKKDIIATYKIDSNKISVVYNGVSSSFKPIAEDLKIKIKKDYADGQDYFVFVGTIHPRKNLKSLIQAFNQFKLESKSKTKLLVIGNRKWWPKELENTLNRLEYKEDIVFLGRQNDDVLNSILATAIALVYVPLFEGFGIPILEAFKSETAVITSNVSSMPEVANGAALLTDPSSPTDISDAMLKLWQNKNLRLELIAKGKLRAEDFSWDKTSNLLWQEVEKILSIGAK